MKIEIVPPATPPGETLPISLSDIKAHLRIEDNESEYDVDLTQLIQTAAEWVFANCHITLLETQYRCYLNGFENPLKIPVFPIQTIDNVTYTDENGTLRTLSSYQPDLLGSPAKIFPAVNETFPTTQFGKINSVIITVTAGYADQDAVPQLVKHLIRLLVGHWFVNREAVVVGSITKEIEFSANELVKMIRVNEFEVL